MAFVGLGTQPRLQAIGVLGTIRDMPRWLRRLLIGVAAHVEAKKKLAPGTLLDTPWNNLTAAQKKLWLRRRGVPRHPCPMCL